jgi:hypothetical protein
MGKQALRLLWVGCQDSLGVERHAQQLSHLVGRRREWAAPRR